MKNYRIVKGSPSVVSSEQGVANKAFTLTVRAYENACPHHLTGAGRSASLHCSPMQPSWSFRFATLLTYATYVLSAAKGQGCAGLIRRCRKLER